MSTRTAPKIDGLKVARARFALPRTGLRPVSQYKLAERAGLHYVTVSNIERGAATNVTLETIGKLADALGVDLQDLLADDQEAAPQGDPFRADDRRGAPPDRDGDASGDGARVTEDAA